MVVMVAVVAVVEKRRWGIVGMMAEGEGGEGGGEGSRRRPQFR